MYRTIIPQRRETLVMISMKMRQEMNESTFRKRFGKVEIVYENVCICYYPGHFLWFFYLKMFL